MGYTTRHKERDNNLSFKLQQIRKNIYRDLTEDSNILGFFYGGSIGKGNQDCYSDLDLRIIVKNEVFETYRRNKKERSKRWGDVLFYEDFPWTTHTVSHYRDFVKVDSFYYKTADLKPSLYLKAGTFIEYDPHGFIADVVNQSQSLDYKVTQEDVEIWSGKFLAHLHEVYRRVIRKEINYALHSLNMMQWSICAGWDMEKDRLPNAMGDWSKYEGSRSLLEPSQKSMIATWNADRNPETIIHTTKKIVLEFKRIYDQLCLKIGKIEDTSWIDEATELVF